MSRDASFVPPAVSRPAFCLTAFILLLLLAGCGRHSSILAPGSDGDGGAAAAIEASRVSGDGPAGQPATPDAKDHGFYPLQVGNHWHYANVFRMDTDGDGLPPEVSRSTTDVELIGTRELLGREYFVQEERFLEEGGTDPIRSRYLYRQDRSGLYEADAPGGTAPGLSTSAPAAYAALLARASDYVRRTIAEPARRAAYEAALRQALARLGETRHASPAATGPRHDRRDGGPQENEITILRYPLHRGQSWTIRTDPFFSARVERKKVFRLPAGRFNGFRIAVTSELFGPYDRVVEWYGHAGFLGLRAHLEIEGTDPNGQPEERMIIEQEQTLDGLDLVNRHRGHDLAGAQVEPVGEPVGELNAEPSEPPARDPRR